MLNNIQLVLLLEIFDEIIKLLLGQVFDPFLPNKRFNKILKLYLHSLLYEFLIDLPEQELILIGGG